MNAAVYVEDIVGASDFGDWLERRMGELPLSQAQLERASGVSAGAINRYRTGVRTPDPATIRKLAGPLQADIDEMMVLAGHLPGAHGSSRETYVVRTADPNVFRIARITEGRSKEDIDRAIRLLDALFDSPSNDK